jgi:hypothetical protein
MRRALGDVPLGEGQRLVARHIVHTDAEDVECGAWSVERRKWSVESRVWSVHRRITDSMAERTRAAQAVHENLAAWA